MERKPPQFVIRHQGMYFGTRPIGGRPGWTWAPVLAERFETEGHAYQRAAEQEQFPGDFEVVPDPTGGKW